LVVIQGGTAVVPSFNGLPAGSAVTVGSLNAFLSYHGNSGSDVTLVAAGPVSFAAGKSGSRSTVRRSGDELQVLTDGIVTDSRPLDAVSALNFTGADNGGLIIDFSSGGFFTLPGGISFQGDGSGTDTVSVIGANLASTLVTYTDATSGSVNLTASDGGSL